MRVPLAVEVGEGPLEPPVRGVGAVGGARAGRAGAFGIERRVSGGEDVGMEAQAEVVVRAAHQRAAAVDDDFGRTEDCARPPCRTAPRRRRSRRADRPWARSLSKRVIASSSRPPVSSVPASKRARVSARLTLPLVVRGIVPGGVTTTRSSSSPAVSRTRRRTLSTTSLGRQAGSRFEHRDHFVGLVDAVDAEDDHARRPDAVDVRDRRFEIRRMVLASLPDDQVFGPPAHEQLTVAM